MDMLFVITFYKLLSPCLLSKTLKSRICSFLVSERMLLSQTSTDMIAN
jgi:hypothetical protein